MTPSNRPPATLHPYSYTLLRNVHDAATGEHVNVGVLVFSRDPRYVDIRLRDDDSRVRALFPDLDRSAFREAVAAVERGVAALVASAFAEDGYADAGAFARAVLPADDSALQWSPVGSGIAADMFAVGNHLFGRLVARYDGPTVDNAPGRGVSRVL